MIETLCAHRNTKIWEPHLAGARKCLDCGMVYNPNHLPQWHIEPSSLYERMKKLESDYATMIDDRDRWYRAHVLNRNMANSMIKLLDEMIIYSKNMPISKEHEDSDFLWTLIDKAKILLMREDE